MWNVRLGYSDEMVARFDVLGDWLLVMCDGHPPKLVYHHKL